jgi:hypothetical protein
VVVNYFLQYFVGGKIAFSGCSFINLSVDGSIKIVVEEFSVFYALEHVVFPEVTPLQPVRLMNLKDQHDVCQTDTFTS